jgi:hypothetical protein
MTPAKRRLGKRVPEVSCQQQKKAWKPELFVIRRHFTKQRAVAADLTYAV